MRWITIVFVAALATVTIASPAAATTEVVSAVGCSSGTGCYSTAQIAAFDSSLGVLKNVVVDVDVTTYTPYVLSFQTYASPDPFQTTGSTHLAYTGPFSFNLNGVLYSLIVSADESHSYTAYNTGFGHEFDATGSTSFSIDKSLLSSFLAGSANCGTVICARTESVAPSIQQIVQSNDNMLFGNYLYPDAIIHYRLTYVFAPLPEPATWMMMLLGFAGIGYPLRRNRAPAMRPV